MATGQRMVNSRSVPFNSINFLILKLWHLCRMIATVTPLTGSSVIEDLTKLKNTKLMSVCLFTSKVNPKCLVAKNKRARTDRSQSEVIDDDERYACKQHYANET